MSGEPEHPGGDRVHEGGDVDTAVWHLLVLDHEDARAAGVRSGDYVEVVHTDRSVSTLCEMATNIKGRGGEARSGGGRARRGANPPRVDRRTRAAREQAGDAREELL